MAEFRRIPQGDKGIRERLEFATIPGVAQGPALVFLIVVMLVSGLLAMVRGH